MGLEPLNWLSLLLITAAGISLVLLWQSAVSAKRDHLPIALPMFLAGISVWLLAYAWELSTLDLPTKILASKVQYLGIAIVPTAWLVYTTSYAQVNPYLRALRWLLAIEPALLTVLVWTNGAHHLIWQNFTLIPLTTDLSAVGIRYGFFFYVNAVYSYGLLCWATSLLLKTLARSSALYRSQVITLVISASVPWLGNLVYLLNQNSFTNSGETIHGTGALWLIDWTPVGFLITGAIVLWGKWRFRLWDTVPIARDALVEGMQDGILVLDRQNRAVDINPAIRSILGLPTSRIIGHPANRVLAAWPLLLEQITSAPNQHRLITLEQRRNGQVRWHQISLSPLYSGRQRKPLGQLLEWRDVTLQKIIELELARSKDTAESANLAKSRFLANMSHEFRTPLNAILGYSELLKEECTVRGYTDIADDLNIIYKAGSNLLSLINNVLEFSKVEAGKLSIFLESFDVIALVMEVSNIVEPLMQQNKNQLEVCYGESIPLLHSDQVKIRQILLNVLANAGKFTANGRVTMSVALLDTAHGNSNGSALRPEGADNAPTWIRFQIQDSGIGMTPEQLQRIFQAFEQAEDSTSRYYGGTGLGLALSQALCHMIGGVISVESKFGEGSTFTVDLPMNCPAEEQDGGPVETE